MATRQLSSVDIQERDDFDQLLDELAQLRGMSITLDIASESDALSAAVEYEKLAAAAQACDVRVSIATDDPVRQELALIYGLAVASTPDAETSILRRRDLQTTVVAHPERERGVMPSRLAPLPQHEPDQLLAPRGGAVLDPDASFSFVLAPPTDRRPRFSETAGFDTPVRGRARRRKPARSTGRALSASALVVAGIVIVAAVAILLIGLLAPSARIVLVPETRAVAGELTYGVAAEGVALDVALEPTVLSEVLTYEVTAPATGRREVPDAKARGMIFLTNPLTHEVVIPAGTKILSFDGEHAFLTVEEIDVPAADPFGAATFGTAVVDVEAVEAGPGGNLDTGELAGELDSGILYQNRFPLEGGTTRTETFVTQQDLDGLAAHAEETLRGQVEGALDAAILPGWLMIGGPETPAAMATSFSADPGTVADEVTIKAELAVEGRVYDPAELERMAATELERRLGAATPEGFSLLLDSVNFEQPAQADAPLSFVLRGAATIQAVIDPALASELESELAGKSEASARRVLDRIEGLDHYAVSYGPDWLPWEPVPQFSNRISVDVDGS